MKINFVSDDRIPGNVRGGGSERRQDLETNYDGDDLLNFQFLKLMNLSEIKCLVVVVVGGFVAKRGIHQLENK